MMHRALLLAGLLVLSAEARAGDDPIVRDATQLMKEGKELFAHSQFERARQRYTKACVLAHTPACLSGLAIVELRAGKPLDAYRHFQEVMRDPQSAENVPATTAEAIPKMMAEAYAAIGHIEVDAPEGAQIRLDGAVVGEAPLQDCLHLDAGDHTIDAERALDHGQVTIHAVAGDVMHARFSFAGREVATGVQSAQAAPTPPIAAVSAPTFALPPVASSSVSPESPPFWTARRTWGVVIGGVGLVALGVGGLFGIAGQNAADRAKGLQATVLAANGNGYACGSGSAIAGCSDLADAYNEQSRDRALNLGFFAVGGVAVLAGAAVFLWPDAKAIEQTAFVPLIEAHGGGFQLRGGF